MIVILTIDFLPLVTIIQIIFIILDNILFSSKNSLFESILDIIESDAKSLKKTFSL